MVDVGRPTKFEPWMIDFTRQLVQAGFADVYIYSSLKISRATFYNWRNEYPKFLDALDRSNTDLGQLGQRSIVLLAGGSETKHTSTEKFVNEVDGKTLVSVKRKKQTDEHLPHFNAALELATRFHPNPKWRKEPPEGEDASEAGEEMVGLVRRRKA